MSTFSAEEVAKLQQQGNEARAWGALRGARC